MIYLKQFELLDEIAEHRILFGKETRQIFNNYYPINLYSSKQFKSIIFDRITIFCGGNGYAS